ncbi:MAG: glyoxalase [Methylococcales symbiont of Iophon sp. n. MRB-2018]|nr:MAG: glyoxalase [Methylococcales symbiont of Iophon sp. n. MRB-2018]KAF3979365.1 MAG: glyoxalase [Methylococcales symbiont of Iophon sp. n. MRB-2018]
MKANILHIHHSSLIVSDTQASLDFYTNIIGLKQLERPNLPFPGAWLEIGTQQIHLLQLDNPDPTTGRPEHGGRDRHVAFMVVDLDKIKDTFDKEQIKYSLSLSGRRALFCRDLDGNALEFIEKLG